MANRLEEYFYNNKKRRIYKWVHYLEVYDLYFKRYVGRPITIVEFGVMHGGSLQMWKHYFGDNVRIIGVDTNPRCKELEEEQVEIVIGDQEDRGFLRKLKEAAGPVDIIIDDGGHTMRQQTISFEEMWPALKDGGVYVVEDVMTSYSSVYGGGYKKRGTFISNCKWLVDQMNAWFAKDAGEADLNIDQYTESIKAIHFYAGLVVFEKDKIDKPHTERHGEPTDITFDYLGYG